MVGARAGCAGAEAVRGDLLGVGARAGCAGAEAVRGDRLEVGVRAGCAGAEAVRGDWAKGEGKGKRHSAGARGRAGRTDRGNTFTIEWGQAHSPQTICFPASSNFIHHLRTMHVQPLQGNQWLHTAFSSATASAP